MCEWRDKIRYSFVFFVGFFLYFYWAKFVWLFFERELKYKIWLKNKRNECVFVCLRACVYAHANKKGNKWMNGMLKMCQMEYYPISDGLSELISTRSTRKHCERLNAEHKTLMSSKINYEIKGFHFVFHIYCFFLWIGTGQALNDSAKYEKKNQMEADKKDK